MLATLQGSYVAQENFKVRCVLPNTTIDFFGIRTLNFMTSPTPLSTRPRLLHIYSTYNIDFLVFFSVGRVSTCVITDNQRFNIYRLSRIACRLGFDRRVFAMSEHLLLQLNVAIKLC